MNYNRHATKEDEDQSTPSSSFQANDRSQSPPAIDLPDELWLTILESPCTFPPDIFSTVMLNLIKNPNITSSHLFRADIFYDSDKDAPMHGRSGSLLDHVRAEYKPLSYRVPGASLTRTIVRQMVPRNPQLDKPLVQTCHFFSKDNDAGEDNIVVYLPHVQEAAELPFYHPAVARLAFSHKWPSHPTSSESTEQSGSISLSYSLFPSTTLTSKLSRTALRLLQTVHKHGQGQLRGYEKRVHLDQIIPQKRYQDTYARLKAKYGRLLSEKWVEVTDPGKHVFEDIGIAAYLVELWRDMYTTSVEAVAGVGGVHEAAKPPPFPGFVDVGCGNGVLTYILLAEGYEGRGFDARERKTWSIFPPEIQARLQRRLLVPSIFQPKDSTMDGEEEEEATVWHRGIFNAESFIISNHADELTAWTPLLAYLNDSFFIAIPCCSHDLAGSRFRAPPVTKKASLATQRTPARLPQQQQTTTTTDELSGRTKGGQAAETGSLARTPAQKKMPSAYSTLCSYVTSLTEEVAYEPEKDVLRIPSTRNQCIVGRRRSAPVDGDVEAREAIVEGIIERELGRNVSDVGREWIERAEKLARKPGSGH